MIHKKSYIFIVFLFSFLIVACENPGAEPETKIEKGEKSKVKTDKGLEKVKSLVVKLSGTKPAANIEKGEKKKLALATPGDGAVGGVEKKKQVPGTPGDGAVGGAEKKKQVQGTPVSGTVGAESVGGGEVVKYTVIFNTNGGTEVASVQVDNGGTVPLPEAPSRSGKRFGGWYTDQSLMNKFVLATKITKAMNLYAKWDEATPTPPYSFAFGVGKHEVVFTDGKYTVAVVETNKPEDDLRTIDYESSDEAIATVDSSGAVTFIKAGIVTITATKEASGEHERATASYELTITKAESVGGGVVQYTVDFDTDEGTEVESVQVDYGGTVTKPGAPSKSGKRFVGWYTESSFDNRFVFTTPITGSMTLYAKWDEVQHTVIYTDGGTEVESVQVNDGETVTKPGAPSKSGKRFGGWYTESSFDNRFVFTTPITGSMTLYAKWDEVQHTVDFNTDGGTEVESVQVNNGGTVTEPDAPSRSGKRFVGWYTESSFDNRFVFTTKITAAMTLYAKWDVEAPLPAYSFAFSTRSHEVVFTSRNTYTGAVVETNKPAGDLRSIEYESSDEAIATVDNKGVVTFIKVGTVTITATKQAEGDHREATANYELTITKMKPKNKAALSAEIGRAIRAHGNTVNLNYIDTSGITDMSRLFRRKRFFNGDISGWDVSKVTNMREMFAGAYAFNQDISDWDVSKVTNMQSMFSSAEKFNQDISEWDVRKVTNMRSMFYYAEKFNQNLEKWGKISSRIRTNRWVSQSMFYKSGRELNRRPLWHKRIHSW